MAAVAVCGLLVLWWSLRHRRRTAEDRMLVRSIRRVSDTFLRHVIVPDGVDGYVSIDFLILTPGGVLVLMVQNYSGILFGGARIDYWTQMLRHKSFKFDNPLPGNELRVASIQNMVGPDTPVTGRVVFTNNGEFPKGIPEGVSMIDQLAEDLADYVQAGEVSDENRGAWERLCQKLGRTVRR